MQKIKDLYYLNLDETNDSSLTDWYNRLIEKTPDDIDIYDIGKMIRQNILVELAIKRAIILFINNPFEGEIYRGDIIDALLNHSIYTVSPEQINAINKIIAYFEHHRISEGEMDEEEQALFGHKLMLLKEKLLEISRST